MIIDGKVITEDIKSELREKVEKSGKQIILDVFVVGENYATEKFIALKQKVAEDVGIEMRIKRFPHVATTKDVQESVIESAHDENVSGIIVQLPLPSHIDATAILDSVPLHKDIDVLNEESIRKFEDNTLDILPPVIGAMKEILSREKTIINGKKVAVLGKGELVGKPAAIWFRNQGANVTVLDKKTESMAAVFQNSDIIVSGAGIPGLITPNMLKSGTILLDAGTSESAGKLSGDADPACASQCSIFTPVPGGIGPITIGILLQNLLIRGLGR